MDTSAYERFMVLWGQRHKQREKKPAWDGALGQHRGCGSGDICLGDGQEPAMAPGFPSGRVLEAVVRLFDGGWGLFLGLLLSNKVDYL